MYSMTLLLTAVGYKVKEFWKFYIFIRNVYAESLNEKRKEMLTSANAKREMLWYNSKEKYIQFYNTIINDSYYSMELSSKS